MTIVLQHHSWDLTYDHEAPTTMWGCHPAACPRSLVIPLDALVSFADPQPPCAAI